MNLVGKIFTVLILVMSLVFMSFAVAVYATHKNWKTVVDNAEPGKPKGYKQQLEESQKELDAKKKELTDTKNTANAEIEAKNQANKVLEEKKQELEKELADKKKEADKVYKEMSGKLDELKLAQDELVKLRTEVAGLRTDIQKAQEERDETIKKFVEATDKMNQKASELKLAKDLNLKLAEEVAKLKAILQKLGINNREPEFYEKMPPKADGIVLAVTGTTVPGQDMVTISLGSDIGMRAGHQLEVSRTSAAGPTYVGRIEVIKTDPEKAVCKVLLPYLKSPVQKGDRVDTRQQQ
jgi:Skp family chaperone for outer membrane proteins